MALFKISRGLASNLPTEMRDGYCWFTTDDRFFYIDFEDEDGVLRREKINPKDAETLAGASLSSILNASEIEIPTSKAVFDALNDMTAADVGAIPESDKGVANGIATLGADGKVPGEQLPDIEARFSKAQALTLYKSKWTSGSGDEKHPYQYRLAVDGVTEVSRADAFFDKASVIAASASGVCAVTDTVENAVVFTSRTAPTADLTGVLYVTKKVAVSGE